MTEHRSSKQNRPFNQGSSSRQSSSSGSYRGSSSREERKHRERNVQDSRRSPRKSEERGAKDGSPRPHRGEERSYRPKRKHSQRGGAQRTRRMGPQRSGYREERINKRLNEPALPDDVRANELDPSILQELRSLSKDNADAIARHMIMAATLLDTDPEKALAHARAAKDRGGRVSITRETLGIAAYHAGLWKEALSELRTARRISGGPGLLAVMADCERALGKADHAIELAHSPEADQLDSESKVELAIVLAGAYHDLGKDEEALENLEHIKAQAAYSDDLPLSTTLRLDYAYADALARLGRKEEARDYFTAIQSKDKWDLFDTDIRIQELIEE